MLESLFSEVAGFAGSATLSKRDSNTGVFLNIYFVEHLQTAASGSCKYLIWTCFEIKEVIRQNFSER